MSNHGASSGTILNAHNQVTPLHLSNTNIGKQIGKLVKHGAEAGVKYGEYKNQVNKEYEAKAKPFLNDLAKQKAKEAKGVNNKTQISFGPSLPVSPGAMPKPVNRDTPSGQLTRNPAYMAWKDKARQFNNDRGMQRTVQGHPADLGSSATHIPGKAPSPRLSRSKANQAKSLNQANRIQKLRDTNIEAQKNRHDFNAKWNRNAGASPSSAASDSATIHKL
jgi:hypothetical protein